MRVIAPVLEAKGVVAGVALERQEVCAPARGACAAAASVEECSRAAGRGWRAHRRACRSARNDGQAVLERNAAFLRAFPALPTLAAQRRRGEEPHRGARSSGASSAPRYPSSPCCGADADTPPRECAALWPPPQGLAVRQWLCRHGQFPQRCSFPLPPSKTGGSAGRQAMEWQARQRCRTCCGQGKSSQGAAAKFNIPLHDCAARRGHAPGAAITQCRSQRPPGARLRCGAGAQPRRRRRCRRTRPAARSRCGLRAAAPCAPPLRF